MEFYFQRFSKLIFVYWAASFLLIFCFFIVGFCCIKLCSLLSSFYHCIQFSIFLLSFYLIDVCLSKMGHIIGVYQACCTESGYVQGKENFKYSQWWGEKARWVIKHFMKHMFPLKLAENGNSFLQEHLGASTSEHWKTFAF